MSNGAANGASAAQMNEIMQAGLAKAADLLDKEEFDAAAAAADDVLLGARLSVLSKCALLRGRAILGPLMKRLEDEDQKDPTETEFREAWVMFQLALRFVPENEEAQAELAKLNRLSETFSSSDPSAVKEAAAPKPASSSTTTVVERVGKPLHDAPLDVIVVGAGALSGVSCIWQGVLLEVLQPAASLADRTQARIRHRRALMQIQVLQTCARGRDRSNGRHDRRP